MECVAGCSDDEDCPEGYRCARWPNERGGPLCIVASAPSTCLEDGCPSPLDECLVRDNATYHPEAECVRPCETNDDCPSGQFCLIGTEIPGMPGLVAPSICREDCQLGGCPEGQTCISVADGSHATCGQEGDVDIQDLVIRRFADFLATRTSETMDDRSGR